MGGAHVKRAVLNVVSDTLMGALQNPGVALTVKGKSTLQVPLSLAISIDQSPESSFVVSVIDRYFMYVFLILLQVKFIIVTVSYHFMQYCA